MFSLVGQCRCLWRWIGRALKHYRSRWDHLGIIFCRKVITTSGLRPPSWNFWGEEISGKVDIYTSENLTPKHRYSHWDRRFGVQFLLPVCTWWCSTQSNGVGASVRGLGVPENRVVAVEITLKCLRIAWLLLLPVLVYFYFRFVFQMLKIWRALLSYICFKHFHKKSVYLFKSKTITQIRW